MPKLIFTNWDNRPAILDKDSMRAVAKLKPNTDWVEVDAGDVFTTAYVMEEPNFKARFKDYGDLSIPKMDFKD